jgi:hypothetical protein
MKNSSSQSWEQYRTEELARVTPILTRLGFHLDEEQVHLGGERSVISGKKLVLLGTRVSDQKRVVIKASSSATGKHEMELEHTCRLVLNEIRFAYTVFLSAAELLWHEERGCRFSITAFLPQDRPFLERTLQEQFFLAMKAFETQESAHATTYEHLRVIQGTFRVFETETYLKHAREYEQTVQNRFSDHPDLINLVSKARQLLEARRESIEQYNGFLTHGDFVPHNIRVVGRDLYLLDHYDIRFGNKYDGWARFLNFMLLHHRELEASLLYYLEKNRNDGERESLHLMRIYRFMELVWYYTNRLDRSEGPLYTLDEARVFFWADALKAALSRTSLPQERIQRYQEVRDSLRSSEEKQRQKGLH